ncbi:hypothetical protein GDO86_005383 [Hymenochirus boettgeri]|uniref:Immunoglobulin domain-containing protein n=1 Tax=Hymenochirus boettgeri TaxID=247094 RepID=A0A8T2J6Q5_9PIPI|nr:hypothetical protein GDO86_005383 [Hymenochirus boettgeri]KAG8439145.1 hypothetical protein GDO86_005383 [Hymenochirus boettgeri]
MIISERGVHSLIFEVVRSFDAGFYECIASNCAGKSKFTLQLHVLAQECKRPPYFIEKPAAIRAFEGETIKMECLVPAKPRPEILLKKNNEMLNYNNDKIRLLQDTSDKISIFIHNVRKPDDGWYTISAINEAGIASCHVRLEVASLVKTQMSNTKQIKVTPNVGSFSVFGRKGLNMQEVSSLETYQHQPPYPGLLESEEL